MILGTTIRHATKQDICGVVNVHIQAFPGFFLTSFGSKFLRLMYHWFLDNPSSVFLVSDQAGSINGFAVGLKIGQRLDLAKALSLMLKILPAILMNLFKNPKMIILRVARTLLRRQGITLFPTPGFLLKSIGVLQSERGNGLARRILAGFENELKIKGEICVYLTTDAVKNDRAVGFYKRAGYQIIQEFKQHNHRLMYVFFKRLA
jgi:ribosomal protein S18 acetylase RimI-like enzyme